MPKSVTYYVLGKAVSDSSAAPFAVKADLSTIPSGIDGMYAIAKMPDGTVFQTPIQSLHLTNKPNDVAKAIQSEADAQRANAADIANANAAGEEAKAKQAQEEAEQAYIYSTLSSPPEYTWTYTETDTYYSY
jgi:hypothetical protein